MVGVNVGRLRTRKRRPELDSRGRQCIRRMCESQDPSLSSLMLKPVQHDINTRAFMRNSARRHTWFEVSAEKVRNT